MWLARTARPHAEELAAIITIGLSARATIAQRNRPRIAKKGRMPIAKGYTLEF